MKSILFICFYWCIVNSYCLQHASFQFNADTIEEVTLEFSEINNLMLIPIQINNSDTLHFILDTGSEHSVIFGGEFDEPPIDTNNLKNVKIAGLGEGAAVDAFVSPYNTVKIDAIEGVNQNLLYIANNEINFSELIGRPVHGILGVSLFHDFIVQINYFERKITFIKNEKYKLGRRHRKLPIEIVDQRPYIQLNIEIQENVNLITRLLIDSGESKAMSLYLNSTEFIFLPYPNYDAHLGKGLTGMVNGKMAEVSKVAIERFELRNVLTAFPNQEDLVHVKRVEDRNGSLGSGILKRFICTFDLSNKLLYIRKNGLLRQKFDYDKTGLIIVSTGKDFNEFIISGVIDHSPASRAGFKKNDVIQSINGVSIEDKKLGDILHLIETSGKRMRVEVDRDGEILNIKMKVFKL